MSWTQDDIDRAKAALAAAGPTQRIQYADGTGILYVTAAELQARIAMMQRDVDASAAAVAPLGRPAMRCFRGSFSAGY